MEHFKNFEVQSQKPSSAMMKLAVMRTATGKEVPELPLLQRIRLLELPALEIAVQISNRLISTSTVQRRLCESGLHGQIAAKKLLLKNTNNKKRPAWAMKHKQWTLDRGKAVLWSDESKFEIFGFNHRVFVRRRGGVMVWGCFAGDTVCDLFRIQGTLNQHGYHIILHDTPSHLVCT